MKIKLLIITTLIHFNTTTKIDPLTLHESERRKVETINFAYSTNETLYNSYLIAKECIEKNIPGDFVECGVATGAQITAMFFACEKLNSYRTIHLFDSFEGIPLAGPNDTEQPGIVGEIKHDRNVDPKTLLVSSGITVHSLEQVTGILSRMKVNFNYLVFYKGWFQHTLPSASQNIKQISFLRLDGDLYESTKVCLEYLYPKIVNGGYIVVDDYALDGCRKAIDEYLEKHNINPIIIPIEGGGGPVYWQVFKEC
jgi:hypothetical protein